MGSYLARRVLIMIPTFLGITFVTLGIAHLAPGDPFALAGDVGATGSLNREAAARFRQMMHLDDPLPEQWVRWVRRIATLDFDRSLVSGRPVIDEIRERLPRSVVLGGLAFFFAYLIAIPLGVLSAARQGSWVDRGTTAVLFALYSLPNFWVAITLTLFLGGGGGGRFPDVFPVQGLASPGAAGQGGWRYALDVAWHLVLPVACLTYGLLASVSRYVRTGMLEVIRQDYIRTARAKGLAERVVVYKHALRNALIPVVTLAGLMIPWLVSGSIVVEQIFGIPGMGSLSFEALRARDYPTIMGVTSLIAVVTMLALLAADVLYAAVDPRIRYR